MLASTKLKVETANRQSTNRVRTAHTLRVGFEVPCNSQVGCVAKPRTRLVGYADYGLLDAATESNSLFFSQNFLNQDSSLDMLFAEISSDQ